MLCVGCTHDLSCTRMQSRKLYAEKCSALGCHDHNINTDSKRRIFNFRKRHRSPEGWNLIRFVFSDISKWRSVL